MTLWLSPHCSVQSAALCHVRVRETDMSYCGLEVEVEVEEVEVMPIISMDSPFGMLIIPAPEGEGADPVRGELSMLCDLAACLRMTSRSTFCTCLRNCPAGCCLNPYPTGSCLSRLPAASIFRRWSREAPSYPTPTSMRFTASFSPRGFHGSEAGTSKEGERAAKELSCVEVHTSGLHTHEEQLLPFEGPSNVPKLHVLVEGHQPQPRTLEHALQSVCWLHTASPAGGGPWHVEALHFQSDRGQLPSTAPLYPPARHV